MYSSLVNSRTSIPAVKTPNFLIFPVIFHFGPSGTAFDSWNSIKVDILGKIFQDGFNNNLIVNPFTLQENDITIMQKAFFSSLKSVPSSSFKFLYKNDLGRFLISFIDNKFLIKPLKELKLNQKTTLSHNRKVVYPEVSCISISPKNDYLLLGFWDGSIYAWDISEEKFIKNFFGHVGIVTNLVFIKDNYFVSGACDPFINYWDYNNQSLIKSFKSTEDLSSVHSLVNYQDQYLVIGFYNSENSVLQWIEIWNLQLNKLSQIIRHSKIFENFIIRDHILIGCYDFTKMGIFNLKKQAFTSVFGTHEDYIRCINYLPKRNLIISGSDDDTTRIWNFCNFDHLVTIAGGAEHLIFTDDEKYIIRSVYDRISIIDCENFIETTNIKISSYITDISISSDNKFIVVSTRDSFKILDFDNLVIILDIDTMKPKILQ